MSERLIYLPLGGAGEIGMNAYVYGYGEPGRERLILVDLGVTFGDMDSAPGIDLIMADPGWLEDNRDRLEAAAAERDQQPVTIVVSLSGRGDKDVEHVRRTLEAHPELVLENM